jgi:site-specific DNA-methyltransferase (adenine-specific)
MIINDDFNNLGKYISTNSVSLVLFDPPYGIGNKKLQHKKKSWNKSSEDWDTFESVDKQYEFYKNSLQFLDPYLTDKGSIFAFGSFHNIYLIGEIFQRVLNYKIVNSIVWYKNNAMFNVTRSSLIESTEHIIWAAKTSDFFFNYEASKKIVRDTQLRNVWESPITPTNERIGHPHQKPFWLYKRILDIACPAGGFVLDPMCGSGTTAISAECKSLPYLCLEKDMNYCKQSQKRLKKYKSENCDIFA